MSKGSGWVTKKLGDICLIERGGSPRPIDSFLTDSPDGINWIKIGDTKNVTKYITRTEEKIRPEGAKRSRMVFEGDFILSNSMSFGRPYIMKTTGCIHDGWLVLREREPKINQDYLYEVVRVVWTEFRPFLDGGAGCPGGGPKAAVHSGLDSALGSHPCVALSSYQAPPLYGSRS